MAVLVAVVVRCLPQVPRAEPPQQSVPPPVTPMRVPGPRSALRVQRSRTPSEPPVAGTVSGSGLDSGERSWPVVSLPWVRWVGRQVALCARAQPEEQVVGCGWTRRASAMHACGPAQHSPEMVCLAHESAAAKPFRPRATVPAPLRKPPVAISGSARLLPAHAPPWWRLCHRWV
jgi:hypothetical protein